MTQNVWHAAALQSEFRNLNPSISVANSALAALQLQVAEARLLECSKAPSLEVPDGFLLKTAGDCPKTSSSLIVYFSNM